MTKIVSRVFSREFKEAAVLRMLAGENVSALARELKLRRKLLYAWRDNLRSGGPQALRSRGRPPKAAVAGPVQEPPVVVAEGPAAELEQARQRIADLERKVGQQQLELDFFQQALQQVRGLRRPSDGPGARSSTPRSGR
jgi:transposase-like protein